MIARRTLYSIGITFLALLLVALLHRQFELLEDQLTAMKYALRGEEQADTNIVIVYIDNEAVQTLGWPVHRNFYALMLKALTDLQVKAVGIDVMFENPGDEYPEYDDLLAGVIASSRKVVLQSYFGSQAPGRHPPARQRGTPSMFSFPRVGKGIQQGGELHLPLAKLAAVAGGIGHVNLVNGVDVPMFLGAGDAVVPSFAMELIRLYTGSQRSDVLFDSGHVEFNTRGGQLGFSTSDDGVVKLNYPGRISSFLLYPFLELLRSYDAQTLHSPLGGEARNGVIPVARLKDKIVIIGVIAEGRAEFRYTPVDSRFPSTALHAVALDNALRSGFRHEASIWLAGLLSLLIGVACSASVLFLPRDLARTVPIVLLVLVTVISYAVFSSASYILPLSPILFVSLTATIGTYFFKHRLVQEQVDTLQTEKESILVQLRDKEAKLVVLERDLLDVTSSKSKDRTNELLEEIRRYKAEIRMLSSRADDMEEFHIGETDHRRLTGEFEGIVYHTTGKMKGVVDFVGKIARSDAPVLVLGESGTGKELVARAIHRRSQRSGGPFVAVNCGALAEGLLESELFGHERGSFTGAVKDKPGRFELADGGTIFLDEIGEVSEAFQLKLLRVLQEGEFERVGGTKTSKVNVRVVAATNKQLKEAVKAKRFRQDLFYRLNVLTIDLPLLRERRDDIPLLVEHFLRSEDQAMRVSKNVMDALQGYAWPGNIRELESTIKRAVLLAKADGRMMITMKDVTEEISAAVQGTIAVEDQVLELLREKGFSRSSISETAEELGGLNRGTVAEYLRGQCLQIFLEQGFDLEQTVRRVSLSPDREVDLRVRKKICEYLSNLVEAIDTAQPWETSKAALQPKTKNLPQRYHTALEGVAEAYFRGLWRLDG